MTARIVPSFRERIEMLASAELARERRTSEVSGLRPLLPAAFCSACIDRWTPCPEHDAPELSYVDEGAEGE